MFKDKDSYEIRLKRLECKFEALTKYNDDRIERLHKDIDRIERLHEDINDRIDMLLRYDTDPEYKEYLRLKDKFEGK